jgi:hypothetical protein
MAGVQERPGRGAEVGTVGDHVVGLAVGAGVGQDSGQLPTFPQPVRVATLRVPFSGGATKSSSTSLPPA